MSERRKKKKERGKEKRVGWAVFMDEKKKMIF